MHHHAAFHDPVLVALSILIAALASYTALNLATRMRAASGRSRRAWLVAAAIAMGGGIWSMHFVGMLAFSMPGTAISYDPFLTLLSLIFPVVVAAAAFAVVGRRPQALLASGLAMGLGIAGMHYTGMAAMRMAAFIESDPAWVVLSIVIAVSASVVALWLAFRLTRRSRPRCANKSKPGRSLRFGRKARECLRYGMYSMRANDPVRLPEESAIRSR
jgi:NO-binding membrane sensor protein with MHYT domain